MTLDVQQCGMCDPQRLRPACAYAQSDQNLCYSLEYSMTVKLLTKQRLEFLSLKGGWKLLASLELALFNMQVSDVNYIIFGHTLCWKLCHFSKKPLRCCLYPGNSLIDGDSIPVELPCVCLASYFVKAGLISLLSPDDT